MLAQGKQGRSKSAHIATKVRAVFAFPRPDAATTTPWEATSMRSAEIKNSRPTIIMSIQAG